MDTSPLDYSKLFTTMPVPRMIVGLSKQNNYQVLDANRQILNYFNHEREQVVGHGIHDFMDHENARHFEQAFEVCLSKKKW